MQERTNQELDVAAMVMLLDCGMSLKDIAECFKLEVKTVELCCARIKSAFEMNNVQRGDVTL